MENNAGSSAGSDAPYALRGLAALLRAGAGYAVDFVLPPRCPATGEIVDAPGMVTPAAWQDLRFIAAPFCDCCGMPFPHAVPGDSLCLACLKDRPPYASLRAALAYDDGCRELILRFKHADQTHVVRSFVPWLCRAGADMLAGADVIVPVPLHRWRLLKRRYNQAGLLAEGVARAAGKPWLPHSLQRRRATVAQGFMNARRRAANVRGAFVVPPRDAALLRGKTVVLVDDVFTTGATAAACTKVLLAAGAAAVHVLTVARVVRD